MTFQRWTWSYQMKALARFALFRQELFFIHSLMSRKPKSGRSRTGAGDEESHDSKADFRTAVFSDKGAEKDRPAELFRMDLVSAMKMSDSDYVDREDYLEITDQWREEWQRPVQVPVNLADVPVPIFEPVHLSLALHSSSFSLPRDKLLHFKADERFNTLVHKLTQQLVNDDAAICKYDADEQDTAWLRMFNVKLSECGLPPLEIETFERFLEAWEGECFQHISKKQGGVISDEDDIVCDVCWTAESEEGNEMVFCDRCDICVHQACYGVSVIPDTAWLCRPCSLGLQPICCLCNKKNGALKPTKSGTRWAHVNCAIWVPEVGFGDPDKMEPITNISKIPENRWSLVCSLCKLSNGAAIQCAVGACKTAFHVTCAFEGNLEVQELLSEDGSDVTLKAFCRKHTLQMHGMAPNKGNQLVPEKGRSTQASREAARSALSSGLKQQGGQFKAPKLEEAEANFANLTSGVPAVAERLKTPISVAEWIFSYWKLKRRSMGNRPLLSAARACVVDKDRLPYSADNPILAALRRFITLRQDLERARNLCYLLVRREKQKRLLLRTESDIYDKLPELDVRTSWRRLFMDDDSLPAIGSSPTVNDLRLLFGIDSVYQPSLAMGVGGGGNNDDKIAEDDKTIVRQSRKKFRDLMKTIPQPVTEATTSKAPKVKRVVSVTTAAEPASPEVSPKATMNPKLNKIRLRLAKSPSARTATIVQPPDEAGDGNETPAKSRKLTKLKIRLPKSEPAKPTTSIFEKIKDDFNLTSLASSTTTNRGSKTVKRKLEAAGSVKQRQIRGKGPKIAVKRKAKRQAVASSSKTAKTAKPPVAHRRIKVPTYMVDEEADEPSSSSDGDSSTSTESSSSDDNESAESSDSETTSEEITAMNPRQMRRRRQAAAKRSEDEESDDEDGSSSSSSSSEEEEDSPDEESSSDENEDDDEEDEEESSSTSDFVKPQPKRFRRC